MIVTNQIIFRILNIFFENFSFQSYLLLSLFFFSFYFSQTNAKVFFLPLLIKFQPFYGGPKDCLVTMFNSSEALLHLSSPFCHCEGQKLWGCSPCTLTKAGFLSLLCPQAQRIIPHE